MELPLLEGGMQMLGPLSGVHAGDWRACKSTTSMQALAESRVGLLSFYLFAGFSVQWLTSHNLLNAQAKHIALHLPLLQVFMQMLAFLSGMHAGNEPAEVG